MQSTMLPARILAFLTLFGLPGCAPFVGGRPIVQVMPNVCSSLLPDEWLKGVPSAELEHDGVAVGDWIKFADAQTGQLDKANERTAAAIGIVQRCEARDAAAVRKARSKLFGMF